MMNEDGSCSIRYTGRENIENKLLASLSDDDKVALVLTLEDLKRLINAFEAIVTKTNEEKSMLHDLINFRKAAFGK